MIDAFMELKARMDQLEEKVDRIVQWGFVDSVDVDAARLVVDLGGLKSMPLPWATLSGRAFIQPAPGEQCVVIAAHGELAQGVVLVGIAKKDDGPGDKDVIEGALEHDRATGEVSLAMGTQLLALADLCNTEFNKLATTLGTGSNGAGTVAFGTPYSPGDVSASKVKGQ